MIKHCRLVDDGNGYASQKGKDGEPKLKELYKNIVEKTFEFSEDRVNIIFGPNKSGKTTLLRAIAGYCGCEDGFTKPIKYISEDEKDPVEIIKKRNQKLSKNTVVLEWDGAPVYYENFRDTLANRFYGSIGDLEGSLFSGIDEIGFIMNRQRLSEGQLSMLYLNKLVEKFINGKRPSYEEILGKADKRVLEYYTSLPGAKEGTPTILLDEGERSFDIKAQWDYIYGILPGIMKKCKVQVIAISHNPLVLSDSVFEDPLYNIIMLDPGYTKLMRDLIKTKIFPETKKEPDV